MHASNCTSLPEPTNYIEEGKRNLDDYGVTVHPGFLPASTLAIAYERLEQQADAERRLGVAAFAYDDSGLYKIDDYLRPKIGKPIGLPGLQRIFFLVNKGHIFIEIAKHDAALAYASHLLQGQGFSITAHYGLVVRDGAPPQPLHVAQPSLPFSVPMPLSLLVMIALTNQSAAMGATRVVPGSHRGSRPKNDIERFGTQSVPIELNAGDAVLLDSRVWHARGASTSRSPRYSLATAYGVDFIKTADNYAAGIHDRVYAEMSDDERILFDCNSQYGGRFGPRNESDHRSNVYHPLPFVPALSGIISDD